MSQSSDHLFILSMSLCNISSSLVSLISLYSLVSSANMLMLGPASTTSGRSLIYNTIRTGPNTDPWGTPLVTSDHSESCPFTITFCLRLQRNADFHLSTAPHRCRKTSTSWVILSSTCWMQSEFTACLALEEIKYLDSYSFSVGTLFGSQKSLRIQSFVNTRARARRWRPRWNLMKITQIIWLCMKCLESLVIKWRHVTLEY